MTGSMLENCVRSLREEVSVEIADTSVLSESYRLRYQVYCVERTFLTGQDGIEYDEYDEFSRHAVVRWIQHVCDPRFLRGLPLATTGEVSRFALAKQQTKQMRSMSAGSCSLLRLALLQGAVMLSAEAGHTHQVAVMEPTLLRLLAATGIHFVPLGPLVDYHGLRQPVVADLVPTLARLAIDQPVVWDFITRGGALYPESRPRASRLGQPTRERVPEAVAA